VRQRLGGGLFAFDVVKHGERLIVFTLREKPARHGQIDAGDCAVAVPVVALVEGEVWPVKDWLRAGGVDKSTAGQGN